MPRLIDADALIYDFGEINDGKRKWWDLYITNEAIAVQPTIDVVPIEFVRENFNLEFVCNALVEDSDWCHMNCQYVEVQPECLKKYIDRIWRKEHDKTD